MMTISIYDLNWSWQVAKKGLELSNHVMYMKYKGFRDDNLQQIIKEAKEYNDFIMSEVKRLKKALHNKGTQGGGK